MAPTGGEHHQVAVGGNAGGHVHSIRPRLVPGRGATQRPRLSVVVTPPALDVSFPGPVARPIEDGGNDGPRGKHCQVGPRAHVRHCHTWLSPCVIGRLHVLTVRGLLSRKVGRVAKCEPAEHHQP
jgi:hypothetical protein